MIYIFGDDNLVKIGFSDNVKKRFNDIRVSIPYKIYPMLVINGGRKDEKILHDKFKPNAMRGEWFTLSHEIKQFISDNEYQNRKYEFFESENDFDCNEQIKRTRKELNISLSFIANKLSIKGQSVYDYEESERKGTITINTLKKVAKSMGKKFEYRII